MIGDTPNGATTAGVPALVGRYRGSFCTHNRTGCGAPCQNQPRSVPNRVVTACDHPTLEEPRARAEGVEVGSEFEGEPCATAGVEETVGAVPGQAGGNREEGEAPAALAVLDVGEAPAKTQRSLKPWASVRSMPEASLSERLSKASRLSFWASALASKA